MVPDASDSSLIKIEPHPRLQKPGSGTSCCLITMREVLGAGGFKNRGD